MQLTLLPTPISLPIQRHCSSKHPEVLRLQALLDKVAICSSSGGDARARAETVVQLKSAIISPSA